ALPRKRARNASRSRSNSSSSGPKGPVGASAGSRARAAFRFQGHTSWHTSHPNTHSPIASRNSSGISPRCSIVRYAMHRRASRAYGPTNAWVGQASRHAVHVPHRSGRRSSHSSSPVVRTLPLNKYEPVVAATREVIHRRGVASLEPAREGGAGLGRPRRPYRHAVEAELARPRLDRSREGQADERHVLRAFTTRWARVSVRPPSSRN